MVNLYSGKLITTKADIWVRRKFAEIACAACVIEIKLAKSVSLPFLSLTHSSQPASLLLFSLMRDQRKSISTFLFGLLVVRFLKGF